MAERQKLSAEGPGNPILIRPQVVPKGGPFGPMPILHCIVSEGASLTYAVEMSEDKVEPRRWAIFDIGSQDLTKTVVRALGFIAVAVRINVTAYVSGSLTAELEFEERLPRFNGGST